MKLPAKVLNIFKYIGLGLGIIESIIIADEKVASEMKNNSQAHISNNLLDRKNGAVDAIKPPDRIVKYDLDTGKEIRDENE